MWPNVYEPNNRSNQQRDTDRSAGDQRRQPEASSRLRLIRHSNRLVEDTVLPNAETLLPVSLGVTSAVS